MQLCQHVLAAREYKADRVVSIPLSQGLLEDKTVLTAQVSDVNGYSKDMLLEQAEWYIRVRTEEGGKAAFLEHIRVSAPEVIRQVIVFAAKNSVELLDREGYVPPGVPANTGAVYYQIKKTGRNWEAICSAHAFSIYATNEAILDHVDRELVAVVQGSFES